MTLEKRIKALEGQAQQGSDTTHVVQGAALFRAKLEALTVTMPPPLPCSPEESESRMRELQARLKALTKPTGRGS